VFRGLQAAVDRAKRLQAEDYAEYEWHDQPIEGWAYHAQTAMGDGPWMRVIGADVEE